MTEPQVQVSGSHPYAVVGRQYCLPYETLLILKDESPPVRDAREVRDIKGNLIFKIADKRPYIRDKTTIENSEGEPVCTIVSQRLSLHETAYLCPGRSENTDECLVKTRKPTFSLKPVLKGFLRGNASDNPDICLTGSFFGHNSKITTSNGVLLAKVNQNLVDERQYFFDAQTFFIRIMPNVDIVLVLALIVMADFQRAESV